MILLESMLIWHFGSGDKSSQFSMKNELGSEHDFFQQ